MSPEDGGEFDRDSLEDRLEDFNEVRNDPGAPSALPNNAAPAARGLGRDAPQQNAEPNGSEGGNAHGSGHYGSLPPDSLPRPLPLSEPIQIKLWVDDLKWLKEEANHQSVKTSEVHRQCIRAARVQKRIVPLVLCVKKGEAIESTLKEMKSTTERLWEAIRAARSVRADDVGARQALYSVVDEAKYGKNRILDLVYLLSVINAADIEVLMQVRPTLQEMIESSEPNHTKTAFENILRTLDLLGIPAAETGDGDG